MSRLPDNLRRAAVQSLGSPFAPPLPDASGAYDHYAPRHFCGLGGKGRDLPGAQTYPDPYDTTQDPDSQHRPFWELRHIPKNLLNQDATGLFNYLMELVARERLTLSSAATSFLALFDPDTCLPEYLPYLARSVGCNLDPTRPVAYQREQIKQAVPIYKQKGLVGAFERLFNSLGYVVSVRHVYVMPVSSAQRSQVLAAFNAAGINPALYVRDDVISWPIDGSVPFYPPGYPETGLTPSNYIDLRLTTLDINAGAVYDVVQDDSPGTPSQPADDYFRRERQLRESDTRDVNALLRDLQYRLEEIRPIHVILRMFVVLFGISDRWPATLIEETLKAKFDMHDDWLPNSGLFGPWSEANNPEAYGAAANVDLRETNHNLPLVHDGMTIGRRTGVAQVTGRQHRTGSVARYAGSASGLPLVAPTPLAQAYRWRPYWGVVEPHRTIGDETVPNIGALDTESVPVWQSGQSYATNAVVRAAVPDPFGGAYSMWHYYECLKPHTSAAASQPGTGSDWQSHWTNPNIPLAKPHYVSDYIFEPWIVEGFELPGAPGNSNITSVVGGGGQLYYNFIANAETWALVAPRTTQATYVAATRVNAPATRPVVVEFTLLVNTLIGTAGTPSGIVLAKQGASIATVTDGSSALGGVVFRDEMLDSDLSAGLGWKNYGSGAVTDLGNIPSAKPVRVKIAWYSNSRVYVYVNDALRTTSVLTADADFSTTVQARIGKLSTAPDAAFMFTDLAMGLGIGPVVEDRLETRTFTNTTTTSSTTSSSTTTTTSTTTSSTTTTSTTTTTTSTTTSTTSTSTTTTSSTTTSTSTSTSSTTTSSTTTSTSSSTVTGTTEFPTCIPTEVFVSTWDTGGYGNSTFGRNSAWPTEDPFTGQSYIPLSNPEVTFDEMVNHFKLAETDLRTLLSSTPMCDLPEFYGEAAGSYDFTVRVVYGELTGGYADVPASLLYNDEDGFLDAINQFSPLRGQTGWQALLVIGAS